MDIVVLTKLFEGVNSINELVKNIQDLLKVNFTKEQTLGSSIGPRNPKLFNDLTKSLIDSMTRVVELVEGDEELKSLINLDKRGARGHGGLSFIIALNDLSTLFASVVHTGGRAGLWFSFNEKSYAGYVVVIDRIDKICSSFALSLKIKIKEFASKNK